MMTFRCCSGDKVSNAILEPDHTPLGSTLQKLETGGGVRDVCLGAGKKKISPVPKS